MTNAEAARWRKNEPTYDQLWAAFDAQRNAAIAAQEHPADWNQDLWAENAELEAKLQAATERLAQVEEDAQILGALVADGLVQEHDLKTKLAAAEAELKHWRETYGVQ